MLFDEWLSRYGLLENFNTDILLLRVDFELTPPPPPVMDHGVHCHRMKANPTWYLGSKYECFLISGCQEIDF